MKIDKEYIGEMIRTRRQRSNITLMELSKLTGINNGNLSKIECGKANPTLDNLLKIWNSID